MITIRYTSIDRCRVTRKYKTLAHARAFAVKYVGPSPELGSTYAVSSDGVGKITVEGVTLRELFALEPVYYE
jgi:hypothetical protein